VDRSMSWVLMKRRRMRILILQATLGSITRRLELRKLNIAQMSRELRFAHWLHRNLTEEQYTCQGWVVSITWLKSIIFSKNDFFDFFDFFFDFFKKLNVLMKK
jgi:hypothetical protein